MVINLTGDGVEINETYDKMVEEKFVKGIEKYLARFDKDLQVADMKIAKETRWGYKVSFNMTLPGKKKIYAEEKNESVLAAITGVRDNVERQLKTYRGKLGI